MGLHRALQSLTSDADSEEALEADIREELRAHLELSAAEGVQRGLSTEQAQRQAIEQFGDLERTISACKRAKLGALNMKHLHLILTASLLLCCGGMVGLVYAERARAAERESAVMHLSAELAHEQSKTAQLLGATFPQLIRVRIGDRLELVGSYNPGEWKETYEVEKDGTVLLPNLGHVQVLGLSRSDLESQLMELYTPYYSVLDLYVRVHQEPQEPSHPTQAVGLEDDR